MPRDLFWLFTSLCLWGMGEGLTFYLRPLYLKQLGADPVAIGSILGLAAMVSGVTHVPAGYLADRFGRRQIILFGWVLGTLAAGLMFLARELTLFVVGLLAYFATAFVLSAINAYAAAARGPLSVQRAITLMSAGFWLGNVFSPALGGVLSQLWGMRPVYGLALGLYVLSTLALLPLKAQPVVPAAHGAARYQPLLRNADFRRILGLMFLALGAIQLGVPLAANFVTEVRGQPVAVVGLLGTATSLGATSLNLLLGQRTPRRGFVLGLGLAGAYVALLLWTGEPAWLGVAFFCQAGMNLTRNMSVAQVGRTVGPAEIGLAFGLSETMLAAALTLAPVAAGLLYKQSPALPFQTSLALIALILPLAWWLAPRGDAAGEQVLPREVGIQ